MLSHTQTINLWFIDSDSTWLHLVVLQSKGKKTNPCHEQSCATAFSLIFDMFSRVSLRSAVRSTLTRGSTSRTHFVSRLIRSLPVCVVEWAHLKSVIHVMCSLTLLMSRCLCCSFLARWPISSENLVPTISSVSVQCCLNFSRLTSVLCLLFCSL